MIKWFKKLWVEFWWGKPAKLTPIERKQVMRDHQRLQRAKITHKKNHKKRAKK